MAKVNLGSEQMEFRVEVDPNELDREWLEQPSLYFQYASFAADARKEWEVHKNYLELVKAEVDGRIREESEKKPSEAAIDKMVVRSPEYQAQQARVNEARHKMDVVNAAVSALDHRKTALTKLVDLFLANYFSKPKSPEGHREEVEEMERRVRHKRTLERLNRARQE